jgi:hypothetical protein
MSPKHDLCLLKSIQANRTIVVMAEERVNNATAAKL